MKKIIIFQILLLIVGKFFLSDVSVKLPSHILLPFLPHGVSVKEVHWIKGQFILKNITLQTKQGKVFCAHANILTYFPELFVQFKGATFENSEVNIFNIQGILNKKGRSYRTIISANNSYISKINFICDAFSWEDIVLPVSQNTFNLPTFSLQSLYVHMFNGKHIYTYLHKLKAEEIFIKKLTLDTLNKHNIYSNKFHISNFKYKDICTGKCFGCFQMQKSFDELNNVIFYTNVDYKDIKNITISCKTPKIIDKNFRSIFYVENEIFKASLLCHSPFTGEIERSHGYIRESFIKILFPSATSLSPLSFKDKIYFSARGVKTNFSASFSTQNISLKNEYLSSAQGNFSVKDLNTVFWNVNLHGGNTNPTLSGQYNINKKQGYLLGQGYIKPELTYQLKEYLPEWWCSFFQNFHYYKNYPYANFQILFDINNANTITFGNSYVSHCKYKNISVDDLNVTFGNQPGFCQLTINTLNINQKQKGKFQIDWPYDKIISDREAWSFKGNGKYSIKNWRNLLENFIGHNPNFNAFDLFSSQSIAKVNVNGFIAHQENKKEHLDLSFYFPQTQFYNIPIKQLHFNYQWSPQKTSINTIKGNFWNRSPGIGQIDLFGKTFKFSLKGENVASSKLLDHPVLKPWKNSIPKENLKTYDGIFDFRLEGQGKWSKELQLSGKGFIDFKNENLSQIHLLGPLSKLFSKRFKWQPNISFNQFISDFTFTENSISSDKSKLLGPSTRADMHGNLDIHKQLISAQIHFSFLDYKQMQFPIMKQVVQIFQPLSKGFSASVSGTFQKPQWYLTFNPFRFVFKRK